MPYVYQRDDSSRRTKYHRTKDCKYLRKKPAKGEPAALLTIDIKDLRGGSPCSACWELPPVPKVVRTYCKTCESNSPCAHNGGVKVPMTVKTRYTSIRRDPGDDLHKEVYIWPDQVARRIANQTRRD